MSVDTTRNFDQTSRTILFEKFNADETAYSLVDLLESEDGPGKIGRNGEEELKKLLTVNTFEQFIEKFAPPVYEIILPPPTDEDGNVIGAPRFMYTLDAKEVDKYFYNEPRPLNKHLYYEMLMQIYKDKCSSRQSDFEYDDSKILEMITPRQEVKKFERLRRSLNNNRAKCYFGELNGEDTSAYLNKYDAALDEITPLMKDKLVMVAQRLDDIAVSTKIPAAVTDSSKMLTSPVAGYLAYDEDGRLTFKEHAKVNSVPQIGAPKENTLLLTAQRTEEIRADIEDVYNEAVPEDKRAEEKFTLDLMLKTLAPLDGRDIDRPALEGEKVQLQAVYKSSRDEFARMMCHEIEKLLGVKAFFDQAGDESGYFEPGLIVANCTAAELLEDSLRDKFKRFISYKGVKQATNRIWLGILPAVYADGAPVASGSVNSTMSRAQRKAARENQLKVAGDFLTLQTAQTMLRILNDAHIMTAFNVRQSRDKEKGVESVTPDYLRNRRENFASLNDCDHAVYAYPNFVIMRTRQVKIDPNEADTPEAVRIKLPGVYVDAAYPAAGIIAASQQIKYLENHGFKGKVNRQNVCVHVNLEDVNVRKNLCSRFNLALNQTWGDVEDDARGFGLAFCGEPKNIGGKEMDHTYIFSARTLARNESGNYRLISRVLLADFIDAYLRYNSID
ncbi:MAG: hypothetical protein IKG61_08090, partial [Selenomonadaceae bacterium]|nr:hypothetical protein [Selenomonadaceae bacterium]